MDFVSALSDVLSLKTVVAATVAPLTVLFVARGIYSLYFSPLSSIPGPWYAAFSELWILVHTFRCRKVRAIDDLYKAYGPIVRIAPNTIAFLDQQSTRLIYNGMKLDKGPLYEAVHMNGHLHSVAIIEHSVHAKYRRIFANHYAPGNIALLHPDMKQSADVLVEKMLEVKDLDKPIDIFPAIHLVVIDVILKSTFGTHQGALDEWNPRGKTHNVILEGIEDYGRLILLSGTMPGWVMGALRLFPNARWRKFLNSGDTLFGAMAAMVREHEVAKREGRLDEREKPTLLERFFAHNASCAPGDALAFEDIVSESMTHLLAGVDASAVLVSYVLWQFARLPPNVQALLRAELDTAMPDARVVPDLRALHALPVLEALFKESLRLYGPIPTFLERLAPKGAPLDLLGHKLPPGTVIGTQSWSMHREASTFPAPEEFDLGRWLDGGNGATDALAPFGLGSRVCVGQHLARAATKTCVAAILRNFEVLPCTETDERSMEMMELFGMFPVGLGCKLIFRPRA